MKMNTKSNAGLYWVIGVIAASMVLFVYLVITDAPRTLPKISLSYFADENEVAESIEKRLHLELSQANSFWIGIEPDKKEQLAVVESLIKILSKNQQIQKIIVDGELGLTSDELKQVGMTEKVFLKEDIYKLGEELQTFENQNTPYVVITASIYSTSLLPGNPIKKLKEKFPLKATTFSFGYFATDLQDEKNFLFACNTEDHAGIKDWGCFVANKARSSRRRLDINNPKPWIGLMDMSGERDYIVLTKKKS
jgi:hypothetical protein